MIKKNLVFGVAVLVAAAMTVGMILPNSNSARAATILCNVPSPSNCLGTKSGDAIGGNGESNRIFACGGDDVISGGGGNDLILGDSNNNCGSEIGTPGADRIAGGDGNDFISHGNGLGGPLEASDGHRDLIDCGPGDDTADINTSVDGDIAVNCEHVIAG